MNEVTTELELLRAENAELRARLTAVHTIPDLPADHDGERIEWRRWEPAPVILCTRAGDLNGCPQCDHPGPSLLAFGLAGPGTPLLRFQAHRCPCCQETRVYRRDRDWRGLELVEIAYHPPQRGYQHAEEQL
ncbi:hypothetical protein KCMC57_64280 (plasmid) [Kitasatospora sp. CMC57]|uniref:Uncharacterized protein n=1 Tax=Kitasatospora sp. CMC57 TaxID=3231513 RepID=A0AB33K790_9ACTN